MKDFLHYLVTQIVDQPDQVTVEEFRDDQGLINLTLKVAQEDMGKVIGKEGRIIHAIRDLVRVLAVKRRERVNVSLIE